MFSGQAKTGRVLLVESDPAQGSLYADIIATHCPGLRIDICRPDERTMLEDNAGGADVAICSCGSAPAAKLEVLRALTTLRPCLVVLVLVPADRPQLADEALAAGASDVLLRAPGYLDQLALAVRKNVALAKVRLAESLRQAEATRTTARLSAENEELRRELCELEVVAAAATAFEPKIEIRVPNLAKAA